MRKFEVYIERRQTVVVDLEDDGDVDDLFEEAEEAARIALEVGSQPGVEIVDDDITMLNVAKIS